MARECELAKYIANLELYVFPVRVHNVSAILAAEGFGFDGLPRILIITNDNS
jgi:hypothetical protein